MSTDKVDLSASQLSVVEAGAEPLLVVAGPGAGKTTVLTSRIQRLLLDTSGSYRKILGITYTNVAATNLKQKLESLDRETRDRVVVSTFHGFSNRLLQQHGIHLGLAPNFSIVNEVGDRLQLLSQAATQIGQDNLIAGREESLLRLLARLYERCIFPSEVAQYISNAENASHVAKLFEAYATESIQEGQLEFSLLVNLATRLLTQFKPLAVQTRQVYEYICVDEFQDTNLMQFRLLEAIAGDDASGLMLLADQDQIIYQWNGASPSRLQQAADRFGAKVLQLPTSYRCPNDIVAAATRLISNNSQRFVKPTYVSDAPETSDIEVRGFASEREEAKWVAEQLAAIPAAEHESTVVLARNRRILEAALGAAQAMGLPCIIPASKSDFESAPIVMLQSMLRLANQPARFGTMRKLATAFYLMTGIEVEADLLIAKAEEEGTDPLSLFLASVEPRATTEQFHILCNIVREKLIARKDFRGVSSAFYSWVDCLQPSDLKLAYQVDYTEERGTWAELEMRFQGLAQEKVSLSEFLRQIDLESKAKPPSGVIKFLTVHGAKGLEFKNVFLIGLAEFQFPAYQAIATGEKSEALEEERRSFFVAITRSMKRLTLTHAQRYFGRPAPPSRFLSELQLASA